MELDIDKLTEQLVSEAAYSSLEKAAIPPRLYYRLRSFINRNKGKMPIKQATQVLARKYEQEIAAQKLNKNECMASFYDSGELRFDFGSNVPEEVKKKAMSWAKKRGLKAVEASLTKSETGLSYCIFSSGEQRPDAKCVKRVRWNS